LKGVDRVKHLSRSSLICKEGQTSMHISLKVLILNGIFFYGILVLIKSKNINVCCFFNDTNNNLYYRKSCL